MIESYDDKAVTQQTVPAFQNEERNARLTDLFIAAVRGTSMQGRSQQSYENAAEEIARLLIASGEYRLRFEIHGDPASEPARNVSSK